MRGREGRKKVNNQDEEEYSERLSLDMATLVNLHKSKPITPVNTNWIQRITGGGGYHLERRIR